MDNVINIRQSILQCFQAYGIEYTEEKLKEIWKKYPSILEDFLNEYHNIVKGK